MPWWSVSVRNGSISCSATASLTSTCRPIRFFQSNPVTLYGSGSPGYDRWITSSESNGKDARLITPLRPHESSPIRWTGHRRLSCKQRSISPDRTTCPPSLADLFLALLPEIAKIPSASIYHAGWKMTQWLQRHTRRFAHPGTELLASAAFPVRTRSLRCSRSLFNIDCTSIDALDGVDTHPLYQRPRLPAQGKRNKPQRRMAHPSMGGGGLAVTSHDPTGPCHGQKFADQVYAQDIFSSVPSQSTGTVPSSISQ